MNHIEFELAMKQLGLAPWSMARAICRTPVSVYKYRNGLSEISDATAGYIRMMVALFAIDPKNAALPAEVRK